MKTRGTNFSAVIIATTIAACFLMMTAPAWAQIPMTTSYTVSEISVDPEPPVAGSTTELCAELQNPTATSETIQVDFGVASLGIGVSFTSVGTTQVVVPAGGKATGCVYWVPSSSGPWSIQVTLSKSGSPDLFYHHNIVFEDSLAPGVTHIRSFKVGNPTSSSVTVSLGMVPYVTGWSLEFSQDTFLSMAPGSVQNSSISVTPPATLPADGTIIVDVEGYAGADLLGGFRMIYDSGSATSTTTSVLSSTTTTAGGNSAPTAFFEVAPSIGPKESDFFVDASGSSDAEDSNQDLLFIWDWETDGTWDTSLTFEQTAFHAYSAPGTYTITLLVEDTGGLTDTATQQVIVIADAVEDNTPPEAIFIVDPPEGDTQTVFYVDALASTDKETAREDLEIRWDWQSDGMWDTDFTVSKTATHLFEEPGMYLITLEVGDRDGLTASANQPVSVIPGDENQEGENTPPHAVVYANPPDGDTRTEFNFIAIDSIDVEDPPEALFVRWDFNSDGIWDTDFDPEKIVSFQYEIPGHYTCRVEVMDTGELTDQAEVEVLVLEPPLCPFVLLLEENELDTMRRFRDDVLTPSAIGQVLMPSYYRHQKDMVNMLMDYPAARFAARNLLKAILWVFE